MNRLQKRARTKIGREFSRFKRTSMFRMTKEEIWDTCHRIHFYCSVYEYFCMNTEIPTLYLELAVSDPALMQTMWGIYLRKETLQYQTWEDIEEILEQVVLHWKGKRAA